MKGKTKLLTLFMITAVFLASVLYFSGDVSSDPTSIECNGCEDCSNKLNGSFSEVILNTDITNHAGTCIIFNADNIVFDGNQHFIDGTGTGLFGIYFDGFSGITIKNAQVQEFDYGIYGSNSNNVIIQDNLAMSNDFAGIYWEFGDNFTVINNWVQSNAISTQFGAGIQVESSNNNIISSNTALSNWNGIQASGMSNSLVTDNVIDSNNNYGIELFSSSNGNSIYYNNIIGNVIQAIDFSGNNIWHNGYPTGGNFWSNFKDPPSCMDEFGGPNQDMPWPDWICDTNYTNGNIVDLYPWIEQNLIDKMPVLEPIQPITGYNRSPVVITLNATDPTGDNLTYHINDSRFEQDPDNVFTWIADEVGDFAFKVWVSDGTYNATQLVHVEVLVIEVSNLSVVFANNTEEIFRFVINNFDIFARNNISWSLDTGENIINSTINFTLQPNEDIFVYVYYNYTTCGNYTVTATAFSNGLTDSESINIVVG